MDDEEGNFLLNEFALWYTSLTLSASLICLLNNEFTTSSYKSCNNLHKFSAVALKDLHPNIV